MAITLPSGYIRGTNEPLDYLYLNNGFLWANVAAATNQTTGLSNTIRYIGQFVNIDDGNGNSELYWFKDGITDPDLVPFASGGGNYTGASPTTVVVENYPIGTPITGVSFNDLFENIYAPVIPPAIPTFSPTTTSFGNLYECGNKLTTIPTADFIFTVTNLANIAPNTLAILDITQGTYLAQTAPVTSPINNVLLNSFPFGLNVFGTNQWGAEVADLSTLVTISSPPYTVTWAHKMWYGTDPNTILNNSQIQALQGSSINSTETIPGTYSVPANANEYKYFCWEDTIPFDPTPFFGFMFGSQQLPMADITIDSNYSNQTPNGWYYALAAYQNGTAFSNYRIFRTATPFGGAMNITIQ
jgi:hypothetical protein